MALSCTLDGKARIIFRKLQKTIGKHGQLYLVGGAIRDTLLKRPDIRDLDFATDCNYKSVVNYFPKAVLFPRFGTASFKIEEYNITISSFRVESQYEDFRHPSLVMFVRSLEEDFHRRDFTINALYADISGKIYDPTKLGITDLKNRIIRSVGDAQERFSEDPLRIVRALRLKFELDFSIEEGTLLAMKQNIPLIREVRPFKLAEEINKASDKNKQEIMRLLNSGLADIDY